MLSVPTLLGVRNIFDVSSDVMNLQISVKISEVYAV
jgi:hypothetical protein